MSRAECEFPNVAEKKGTTQPRERCRLVVLRERIRGDGKVENLILVFQTFHSPGISIASFRFRRDCGGFTAACCAVEFKLLRAVVSLLLAALHLE